MLSAIALLYGLHCWTPVAASSSPAPNGPSLPNLESALARTHLAPAPLHPQLLPPPGLQAGEEEQSQADLSQFRLSRERAEEERGSARVQIRYRSL